MKTFIVRKDLLSTGIAVLFLACTVSPLVFGQETTGTISGIVTDPSRARVADVKVSVRNLDTEAIHSVTTETDGRYNFPGLPVGRYKLTAEVRGFAKYVRSGLNLLLNQVAVINVDLRLGALESIVTITEDAPILNTRTAEVGVRFDEKRVSELPIFVSDVSLGGGGLRDVFSLVLSAPGVSQLNSGNSSYASGVDFSVNGMRTRGNNITIDGQDSNDPIATGRAQWMNNPDVVQEFRLITNQFLPEYGRSAGSVVNVVTKKGSNSFHGSAFWFHNDNTLNSQSNLDQAAGFRDAPWRIENQFGGTAGGPIRNDHTFFFGSLQRWTDRKLGSGTTIAGIPTAAGQQTLRQLAGSRPQVAALLTHLPTAQNTSGPPVRLTVGGQSAEIPVGTLTNSTNFLFNNWQWSTRIDHQITDKHQLGGRYLYSDTFQDGEGQTTPPGLTNVNPVRSQAMTVSLTSSLTPRLLNDLRVSWQRLGTTTTASNRVAEEIPSIEVTELGLTGSNAASSRTAIGLGVNLPQFRFNNIYQIQENLSWTRGSHAMKFGVDLRRTWVKSFFFPRIRGLLRYPTLQRLVDDVAEAANINKPLPGGQAINYYEWDDYFFYLQDSWAVRPTLTLNFGLRYESPGNAFASLYPLNQRIVQTNGGNPVFSLTPRPERDKNNFQPRFGFSWNPQTRSNGILGWLTGGNKFVVRGGYSRLNDYAFINIALNVVSSFPFVAAINNSNLANAFTLLPALQPDLSSPTALNQLTRTVVDENFRSPIAEQYSFEVQRQVGTDTVVHLGYVGTKGTALFQTIDGNPRTICATPPNCPRVDPSRGVIRLRANASSSIYHSLQASMERRYSRGISAGAHYTWSAFIDDASEIFNPSVRGEVAVSQDSFNRSADRGRSTYDRPHRLATNFVWELPFYRTQRGATGRILGGWQLGSFLTFQGGSPFTPLNGVDPGGALAGIDALVGNAIRPNLNTTRNVSNMSVENLVLAGGRTLYQQITAAQRVGNAGRSSLRSDGIATIDFSIMKSFQIIENHRLQFRTDFFNLSNTRNFGIPESRVNNTGFGNQWGTDGGNRRILMSLRYVF